MPLFKKTKAQIFAENTADAEPADHFKVNEMPERLQPWAFKDYRVVQEVLKSGITAELIHLGLNELKFKRGDELILRQMTDAAAAGFLMLPDGTVPNPYRENAAWDCINAEYPSREIHRRRFEHWLAPIESPTRSTSPIEPSTPSIFDDPEQVISDERPSESPPSDFEIPSPPANNSPNPPQLLSPDSPLNPNFCDACGQDPCYQYHLPRYED